MANDTYFWCAEAGEPAACVDVHAAFRGELTLAEPTTVSIDHVAVSWYNLYIDGERKAEGPTRFTGQAPYFERTQLALGRGKHVIAIHAHSAGVQTRTLLKRPAAVFCRAQTAAGKPLAVSWTCSPLKQLKSQWNRISTLLGWAECVSVDKEYCTWMSGGFSASPLKWRPVQRLPAAKSYEPPLPLEAVASAASSVAAPALGAMAQGQLWERYGYADDDPAARSYLRKLVDDSALVGSGSSSGAVGDDYGPAQGRWWRFDIGKCRLTRLALTVNAPAGTVFEVSYAQELIDGRVSPWMTLCGSTSCYLDRYTIGADVGGTEITLCPLEPRGCRYIEVHAIVDKAPILADPAATLADIKLVAAVPLHRGYAPMQAAPTGAWASQEVLLNRIWSIGIETTRSCTEDTAIDGPCRERGQWTGDTLAVTLQNVASCYSDVRALKLCLTQASSSDGVDKNGMISGNCPENTYPLDYVFIWFQGAMAYFQATGDKPLLSLLYPRATRCMDYLISKTKANGLATKDTGCGQVVDWGYQPPPATTAGGVDITLNCFYLQALAAMSEWCKALGKASEKYDSQHRALRAILIKRLGLTAAAGLPDSEGWVLVQGDGEEEQAEPAETSAADWASIGYHASSMALAAGLLGPPPSSTAEQADEPSALQDARAACIAFIKTHLSSCFPNDRSAPRAANPSCANPKLYTPYYATFSFPALIEYGELEWVLGQYRSAWGWASTQSSTWLEVFDPRWEKVHSWSGCPTWQLSVYTLGLSPRYDVGPRHFDLRLYTAASLGAGPVSGRCARVLPCACARTVL